MTAYPDREHENGPRILTGARTRLPWVRLALLAAGCLIVSWRASAQLLLAGFAVVLAAMVAAGCWAILSGTRRRRGLRRDQAEEAAR